MRNTHRILLPKIVFFFLMPVISVFLPCLHTDSSAQRSNVVKIGVASMTTPVETVKYYQGVIDYIGEQINRPVQMVYRKTYGEMDSLLEKGEVEIAFICSAPYVRNYDRFGVELLAAPSVNGSSMYHSYIVVHKDSPYVSFTGLRGKSFAFTDPKSNTGALYPTYLLKTMGHTPAGFFKSVIYSYSHNKSVEMVAKKIVDGAAVESIVYEYMLKTGYPYAKQVKVIKRSPPFGIPPVVVTRDIDPVLKKKVRDAFLNMQHTTKGKAILDAMTIDGFVEVPRSNYDTVRAMEYAVSDRPGAARNGRDGKTVYFGVIPRDNPRIIYEKYQPLLDYLAERTPYRYELVLKKNYEETVKALGNGETGVALLGPLTYLEAHARYGAICILKTKGADGGKGVAFAGAGSIPTGPLVAGPATPADVINSIKKALLELNPQNGNDSKILNRLDEGLRNGFIEASDRDYEGIRKKINAVPQTCGMGCHPKIRL